ncbi:uncharacterized protein LOC108345199 [Vigna angularis]|uniref:uncharacterized protein LOC108345199 n=1 Tax=Phaseolus angularis TaxID=3914 RepID=UPI00080A64C8|nr:uncharacterized protein LOC108345199 [Vigna angularis]
MKGAPRIIQTFNKLFKIRNVGRPSTPNTNVSIRTPSNSNSNSQGNSTEVEESEEGEEDEDASTTSLNVSTEFLRAVQAPSNLIALLIKIVSKSKSSLISIIDYCMVYMFQIGSLMYQPRPLRCLLLVVVIFTRSSNLTPTAFVKPSPSPNLLATSRVSSPPTSTTMKPHLTFVSASSSPSSARATYMRHSPASSPSSPLMGCRSPRPSATTPTTSSSNSTARRTPSCSPTSTSSATACPT